MTKSQEYAERKVADIPDMLRSNDRVDISVPLLKALLREAHSDGMLLALEDEIKRLELRREAVSA